MLLTCGSRGDWHGNGHIPHLVQKVLCQTSKRTCCPKMAAASQVHGEQAANPPRSVVARCAKFPSLSSPPEALGQTNNDTNAACRLAPSLKNGDFYGTLSGGAQCFVLGHPSNVSTKLDREGRTGRGCGRLRGARTVNTNFKIATRSNQQARLA